MTGSRLFLFGAFFACLAAACTPSPDGVCKHMKEIGVEAAEGCMGKLTLKKSSQPEQYKAYAKCVMGAKDKAGFEKCAPLEPSML